MDLFGGKPKVEITLSVYKKPEKKVIVEKEKVKKEKRLNKVSGDDIPPFGSEERRKEMFPNYPPLTLKQLKERKNGLNHNRTV